jgi:hypothetical protein
MPFHGKVLKTHLLGTIAQDGVECELREFCVSGVARRHALGLSALNICHASSSSSPT